MHLKQFLTTTAILLASIGSARAAQTELTVIGYGGSFQQGWEKAVIEPFEKANPDIKINVVTAGTVQGVSMMRTQRNDVKIDVMMLDEQGAAQTAAEGLYEPLTAADVPNLAKLYPTFRLPNDVYARFMYTVQVIVYNKNEVKEAPTGFSDLWNPKYVNKTAVAEITTTPGIFLLMALMDSAGQGGKPSLDGGFELLRKIKPNIVTIWSQMAQLEQLMLRGDVWISTWPSNRAQAAVDSGAPLGWIVPEGAYINASTIGIAKGSKNVKAAQKYIDFVLGAEAQAANAGFSYLNPVNSEVKLSAEVAKKLPSQSVDQLKAPDWNDVLRNLPRWSDRWNRELSKN
jgi:putative spermidine/putrescine transport system substrate-binding protein